MLAGVWMAGMVRIGAVRRRPCSLAVFVLRPCWRGSGDATVGLLTKVAPLSACWAGGHRQAGTRGCCDAVSAWVAMLQFLVRGPN